MEEFRNKDIHTLDKKNLTSISNKIKTRYSEYIKNLNKSVQIKEEEDLAPHVHELGMMLWHLRQSMEIIHQTFKIIVFTKSTFLKQLLRTVFLLRFGLTDELKSFEVQQEHPWIITYRTNGLECTIIDCDLKENLESFSKLISEESDIDVVLYQVSLDDHARINEIPFGSDLKVITQKYLKKNVKTSFYGVIHTEFNAESTLNRESGLQALSTILPKNTKKSLSLLESEEKFTRSVMVEIITNFKLFSNID